MQAEGNSQLTLKWKQSCFLLTKNSVDFGLSVRQNMMGNKKQKSKKRDWDKVSPIIWPQWCNYLSRGMHFLRSPTSTNTAWEASCSTRKSVLEFSHPNPNIESVLDAYCGTADRSSFFLAGLEVTDFVTLNTCTVTGLKETVKKMNCNLQKC